ncbi:MULTISPECIES: LacI family DNA-binding transcriptional regulator [Actinomadura]|jgi:DNA-binding LacI/PurR family transcriptional regulator|uniref:LacI family DNA-binding transcriptional regulator n=1 Tax=Actinomadura keratinilytica TaxID=547461 RepID=A0ABP7YVW0_9ACTN|nr:LacI family DNA-binding transcriptional regulator [Actinomadura sp. NBRC 104425]GLZ13405.1 LacI family transcriptional regulator [Actinomadura sp. NBRC 104425]
MAVRRPSDRPTLEEVAARAGVGRGTVSRVINGSPRVSRRAREAVLRAIDELGYVPNRAARTLVTRRTDTVALVVAESELRVFDEPFFAGITRGISSELNATGLQLLLALAQSPDEYARLEQYLTGQHVDGVLLTSLHADDPLPAKLEANGVPTVLGGRPPGLSPVSYVDVDNRDGARRAVQYLLDQGRRRIATVAGPQDMGVGIDRLAGYREALAEAGLPELVVYGDFSEASGVAAAEELLEIAPDLDAVFAADDPMALGAMRVLKKRGRRIPEDVAVIGFEDSASAPVADPPLTTVHQSVEEMGRSMARLLVSRIRGEAVAEPVVILQTHLVLRESA